MAEPIGLYFHVPFCDGKCPYCDFYSLPVDENSMNDYTNSIIDYIEYYSTKIDRPADTLYFGGGTPSILGAQRICAILQAAKAKFGLVESEVTLEVNPTRELERDFFFAIAAAGVNRISVGLQSADEAELKNLGRRHTARQAAETAELARRAGIENLSMDLMLGISGQTRESLLESIRFCVQAGASHVSAYLLKVEPGTWYYKHRDELALPPEEEVRELYLSACQELRRQGLFQYEISNFSAPGFESRHNLKYWNCQEYLGIGPAAHSFLNNKRFYYDRSLRRFLQGEPPRQDGAGGGFEEYAMLRLRLTQGLQERECRRRFGCAIPLEYRERAKKYAGAGLLFCDQQGIRFTEDGFLVSNALIGEILF